MPRYFFHLHAGERRANSDSTGQLLPDPDAAREMARRIAGRLLAWNLEPVPWLDYQVHVTDEAGAIVCQLPLTEVADLPARAGTEVIEPPDREVTSQAEADGWRARLNAEIFALVLEVRPAPRPRADVQGAAKQALPFGLPGRPQEHRRTRASPRESRLLSAMLERVSEASGRRSGRRGPDSGGYYGPPTRED